MDIARKVEQLPRLPNTGMQTRGQEHDKILELPHRLQSLHSSTRRIEETVTPTRLVRAHHTRPLLLLDRGTRAPDRDHDWRISIRMFPSLRLRLDRVRMSVIPRVTPKHLVDLLLLQSIPELDHHPTFPCPGRRNIKRKPDLDPLQLADHRTMTKGPGRSDHRQSKSINHTLPRPETLAPIRTFNKSRMQVPNTKTNPSPDETVPCNLLPLLPRWPICPSGQSDSQWTTMDTTTRAPLVLPIQPPDHLSARCP
jgi:hypothetical protein